MRHEVLYQYDLPIEVLDEIPRSEEVLEVIYARSPEKYLLPVLFTRLRIVWAYPERQTVYRIYEMNYVDLVEVLLKYPPTSAIPAVMTITTVTGEKFAFRNIKTSVENMRGALLTLRDIMMSRVGGRWELQAKKTFISEEYVLKEVDDVLNEAQVSAAASDDDLFERKSLPGDGCYEENEALFSHFPEAKEPEVFEAQEKSEAESREEFEEAQQEHLQRIIDSTVPKKPAEGAVPEPSQVDDSVVMTNDSGKKDDQWERHDGGDALILPGSRTRVGGPKYKHLEAAKEHYSPEDDDSEVYVSDSPKPQKKVVDPKNVDPVTLEARDDFDIEQIDRTLASLKQLRESGIISDDEYREKCRSVFEKSGM